MINIHFYEKDARYAISAKGHAEYAPHGQDIVCAAVSVLLQSYGNYLEYLASFNESDVKILEIKYDSGDINVEAISITKRIKDCYRMTMRALEDLHETYPGFISLEYN